MYTILFLLFLFHQFHMRLSVCFSLYLAIPEITNLVCKKKKPTHNLSSRFPGLHFSTHLSFLGYPHMPSYIKEKSAKYRQRIYPKCHLKSILLVVLRLLLHASDGIVTEYLQISCTTQQGKSIGISFIAVLEIVYTAKTEGLH